MSNETLYEMMEKLSDDEGGIFKLLGPIPVSVNVSWSFHAHVDGLVHTLIQQHATWFWGTMDDISPGEGITECGLFATLIVSAASNKYYDTGYIVPGCGLTCIRCLSGIDNTGKAIRLNYKQWNAAAAYGMSLERMSKLNINKPNVQQVPRGKP